MATALDDLHPITFVVPGVRLDGPSRGAGAGSPLPPPFGLRGQVSASVQVGTRRAGGLVHRLSALPGRDLVVLHLADGPALVLHPAHARDLLLAQSGRARGLRSAAAPAPAPDEVEVPSGLRWQGLESAAGPSRGATRGFLGQVLLKAIELVAGPLQDQAEGLATAALVKRIDDQVAEGVYALNPEALPRLKGQPALAQMPAAPAGAPTLVFVHGTFSESSGGFGKLWTEHPQRVRALFRHFGDRVYALDHATLGRSPIDNALTLAKACPPGARLQLVTHSRGGLVAEVLARAASLAQPDDAAAELFADPAWAPQRDALQQLITLLHTRDIRIERIVRVACPARGTLLASGRLDAYLSVLKWALELARIPVLPELVDFLGGVAQRRTDPMQIPGIAAMVPDSPVVRWIHATDTPVPGELRVVAGDLEGDSLGSWFKTLVSDAYYWTDNDLVVQTSSMYGGAPRAQGASFVLDRGGKVTHFNYFASERTADAVVGALLQQAPAGWRVIGPLSQAGESAEGLRGLQRGDVDGPPASSRPAVFVLPGILGSHLKVNGRRIWLGWRLVNGLKQLAYPSPPGVRVEPDGPIGSSYDALMDFLARSHEVIEFSFDWRRPIEEEARRLGAAVEAALDARAGSGQPVRLLAHSMGGVLARTMQLECGATWDRLMAHPGARLLMLGTPNGGSWAPMQVLSGDDGFGNTLVGIGAPFQDHAARQQMAAYPGFLQLQAGLLDERLGLARSATWRQLADDDLARVREFNWWHSDGRQLDAYRWGVPADAVLAQAVALRQRLDAQREQALPRWQDKLLLVVGQARFTPDGYELGSEGLVYLNAPEAGDGRVTLASALLPGVRTWALACDHGALPDAEEAFEAYLELLVGGSTQRLPMQRGAEAIRGAGVGVAPPVHVRSRPARERRAPLPRERDDALWQLPPPPGGPAGPGPDRALRITVHNGDLGQVRHPLMLGHYASNVLTGTEQVVNRLIGNTMEDALAMGRYPERTGSHQVFVNTGARRANPLQPPRPESVIVVGLGAEGELTGSALAFTVRQGVLALAQRLFEQEGGAPPQFELASTLIGSGGSGISVGQAAQMIAQGVREADRALRERNERLAAQPAVERRWPRVGTLHLIELFLDRAGDAWRALQVQAQAAPGEWLLAETIACGPGALRRPLDGNYRGSDYDYISAISAAPQGGDADSGAIHYAIDTRRARTELRAQSTQRRLVEALVHEASSDQNTDRQIGRTLFKLLVPADMEPYLGGSTEMLLEVDPGTAGIPWEMLDTPVDARRPRGGDERPWAIRSKLVRKLRLADFRPAPMDVSRAASALVIGEPLCDDKRYPRLPGARAEARTVREQLSATGALGAQRVQALIAPDDGFGPGPDARQVINALMAADWRIVHISGHGEPPEPPPPRQAGQPEPLRGNPRGVVLSHGSYLGPHEIENMRVVPELVFVNCCHLAARPLGQLQQVQLPYDRAQFASGVAEALIRAGVRCVVAAGWAVEDGPASVFASTFYTALLRGARFIEAVAEAREATWALGGNTWAAYQCYGDPGWVFQREGADPQRPAQPLGERYAGVTTPPALTLALEALVIGVRHQGLSSEEARARIRHLEARCAATWGGIGAVAEAFGLAWQSAGSLGEALGWYGRALAAEDGSASLQASEQLGALRVQQAWAELAAACRPLQALLAGQAAPGELSRVRDALAPDFDTARQAIGKGLAVLQGLAALRPTRAGWSLCARARQRLAMLEHLAGRDADCTAALQAMRANDVEAEACGREAGLPDLWRLSLNQFAVDAMLLAGTPGWPGLAPEAVARVRAALSDQLREDPGFAGLAAQAELALCEALAAGTLAAGMPAVAQAWADLHARVPHRSDWAPVQEQVDFVLSVWLARGIAPSADAAAAARLREQLAGYAGV